MDVALRDNYVCVMAEQLQSSRREASPKPQSTPRAFPHAPRHYRAPNPDRAALTNGKVGWSKGHEITKLGTTKKLGK